MLRDNDLQVDVGRAAHGGDFMRLVHVPTGLSRCHPGPLANIDRRELVERWRVEIEAELREKGLSQYIIADALAGGTPGNPRGECLAYFRQAIESPGSVAPWAEWWGLNQEKVRHLFSRRDYLKLKHRKLAGAEVILEQDGWHCPLCLDRDPIRTGHCPTCSEKLVWKEAGSGGGDVFCPNGCWNAHYYTGHDETFWKQFAR